MITAIEEIPAITLLTKLRQVRLRGYDQAQPYLTANIEIRYMNPEELWPAQNYVLADTMEAISSINCKFMDRWKIDVREEKCGHWLTIGDERIPYLPPIIESSEHIDGTPCDIIADGLHRVKSAYDDIEQIMCLYVQYSTHPYYAYPEPARWDGVQVLTELPDEYRKKRYRDPQNYKRLFRMFNEVFPGVQKQRKRSNPKELTA